MICPFAREVILQRKDAYSNDLVLLANCNLDNCMAYRNGYCMRICNPDAIVTAEARRIDNYENSH
jgi:hypothetical protein